MPFHDLSTERELTDEWRDSSETQEDDPEAGGRRGRGLSDRGRPRKYTKINFENIDYKDLTLLRRFLSDRGKTRSRRVTGLSRRHQQPADAGGEARPRAGAAALRRRALGET